MRSRIIPARAGQTFRWRLPWLLDTDHPRACGANTNSATIKLFSTGSSPRVRGKHARSCGRIFDFRIIPARAGQTRLFYWLSEIHKDHPRACGANTIKGMFERGVTGSSPRVRGKPVIFANYTATPRIIPARAGQTRPPARPPRSAAVIPARAGQTWQSRSYPGYRSDHPRACGANLAQVYDPDAEYGSSPRVRGKRSGCVRHSAHPRIIPARAGQTSVRPWPWRSPSNHPRACGANRTLSASHSFIAGSSPRVRGKLGQWHDSLFVARIIPARAGQTSSPNV